MWNGEFIKGDYQYNNKTVLRRYQILKNISRLKSMNLT